MKAIAIRAFAALLLASAAAGASAEYRCNPAPSPIDRRACEAAQQGPDALRHFIERMQMIQSLYFFDYVDDATLLAWEEKSARESAAAKEDSPAPIASKEAR